MRDLNKLNLGDRRFAGGSGAGAGLLDKLGEMKQDKTS
jgi:hypothetical protein